MSISVLHLCATSEECHSCKFGTIWWTRTSVSLFHLSTIILFVILIHSCSIRDHVCYVTMIDRTVATHVIENWLPMFYRACSTSGECTFAQSVGGHGNCNGAVIFNSSTSLMTGIQQHVVTGPGNTVSTWPDLTRLHYDTFVNPIIIASNSCKLDFSQKRTHQCLCQSCCNLLASFDELNPGP